MNDVFLSSDIELDSIVNGKGLRAVIWFQGCGHACEGCHNPETWEYKTGVKLTVDELKVKISALEDQDGITFSGGDPFFQPDAFLEALKHSKSLGYNVWVYTGFVYEDILKMKPIYHEILSLIDVLIDGKFELDKKTQEALYRGSSNQRVIDIKESLEKNITVTLYD